MSSAKLYGVYTAQFPFLEASDGKVRPVIVVSMPQGSYKVIAIIPISSKANREPADAALNDWNNEGLIKHPCGKTTGYSTAHVSCGKPRGISLE